MEKNLYSRRQKALLELLVELRRAAKLKQVDVAEALGRPQSFVSKYESGERRLDILELYDVCAVLGCKLESFAKMLQRQIENL